jgi:hypothetical protein
MSDEALSPPPPPAFKNRRPGLIGCGVVHLLFGLMFVGFSLLMVLMVTAMKNAPQEAQMPPGMVVYTSLFYLILAALFVTLGIGSMMARRWAPPLIQVTSWAWLVSGVVGGAVMGVMLPKTMASLPNAQPGAQAFTLGCMAVVIGLFGVGVPLAFLLFYRSTHVKATVEMLDPVPRWTDRHPVSILIFAAWMLFGAVCVLLSSFMYKALPIAGMMLRGWPVFVVMAAMATLLFWIGVGTLKRSPAAWWSAIGMMIIGVIWGVSFMMSDPKTLYESMGMTLNPQQEAMTKVMYSSPFFYAWIAIVWIGYLVFLLYLRRYFFPQSKPSSEGPAVQPPVDLH